MVSAMLMSSSSLHLFCPLRLGLQNKPPTRLSLLVATFSRTGIFSVLSFLLLLPRLLLRLQQSPGVCLFLSLARWADWLGEVGQMPADLVHPTTALRLELPTDIFNLVAARSCSNRPATSALRLFSRSMYGGWRSSKLAMKNEIVAPRQPGKVYTHTADEHVAQEEATRHKDQPVPSLLAVGGLGQVVAELFKPRAACPGRPP